MTRNEYIQKLAAELRGFDKAEKDEILQEIKGLISDSGCNDEDLIQRFGTPLELAVSYGKKPVLPKQNMISGIAKKLMIGVGIITTALIAIGVYFFWTFESDEFDYSDANHPLLSRNSSDWKHFQINLPATLNVEQSKVVIYWHDSDQISWKCENRDLKILDASMKIDSNRCFVFLPKKPFTIKTTQAQIVLVDPSNDLDLDIFQTNLRIATLDKTFQLSIDQNSSDVAAFANAENPESIITIDAKQSSVDHYKY